MRRGYLTAACCFLAVLLAGCGYKDGTYSAEFTSFDSLGYKDRLQVTVTDGVITDAQFDGINEAGGLKSEDEAYAERMRPLCGTDPAAIGRYYSEALTGLEDPDDLQADGVSGATVSAQHFAALWQALQTPMKEGETAPVTVADIPEFSSSPGIGE